MIHITSPLSRVVVALLAIAGLLVTRYIREPEVVVEEQTNQCVIDPWGEYRENGPWSIMYKYCTNGQGDPERLKALRNAVKLGTPKGHDMVTAADFGSNVKLLYFPSISWMPLNPIIIEKSPILILCRDFIRGREVEAMRSNWVKVKSLDEMLREEIRLVEDRTTVCLLQAVI